MKMNYCFRFSYCVPRSIYPNASLDDNNIMTPLETVGNHPLRDSSLAQNESLLKRNARGKSRKIRNILKLMKSTQTSPIRTVKSKYDCMSDVKVQLIHHRYELFKL